MEVLNEMYVNCAIGSSLSYLNIKVSSIYIFFYSKLYVHYILYLRCTYTSYIPSSIYLCSCSYAMKISFSSYNFTFAECCGSRYPKIQVSKLDYTNELIIGIDCRDYRDKKVEWRFRFVAMINFTYVYASGVKVESILPSI